LEIPPFVAEENSIAVTNSITRIVDKGTLRMKEILRQVANLTRSIQKMLLNIHLDNIAKVSLE
jgi:hypothetical protein